MWKLLIFSASVIVIMALAGETYTPEFIKPCSRKDPDLNRCIINSLDHLRPYLSKGIPEIEMPSVEPFIMDQLSLQLTDGPQGYKITLRNIEVYGTSNFHVKAIKLSENGEPFEATVAVPKMTIDSKYTSSGVLLVIPASGGGEFHAELEGAVSNLTGTVSYKKKSDGIHLHVDNLRVGLGLDKVHMSIAKAFNNNRILTEATNLFLREHGQEVVSVMQPQLEKKLAQEFGRIVNILLKNIPQDTFYID